MLVHNYDGVQLQTPFALMSQSYDGSFGDVNGPDGPLTAQ